MIPPKEILLDHVHERMWLKNYAYRTEKLYPYWIKKYILFHNKRHPNEIGDSEFEQFLNHLEAKNKNHRINSKPIHEACLSKVLNALLFLYDEELDFSLDLTFQ